MSYGEYERRKLAAIETYLKIVKSITEKDFIDLLNNFDRVYNCKYKQCERYNFFQNSQCILNIDHYNYNLYKPCEFDEDIPNKSKCTKREGTPELIEYSVAENIVAKDFLRINATWH